MEIIPIKTRVLQPPTDDLLVALDESLLDIQNGDIIAISSKVIAINEGRCAPVAGQDKKALLQQEADIVIPREYWHSPLTVTRSAFIGTAGIDESNADGHYILLPKNPMQSAEQLHEYFVNRFKLTDVGVIITDSHSTPFRRGASGIAIGFWGFKPTINHVGEPDLFDRPMKVEVSNLIDGLAAAATVVMGETNDCQPVAIMRDVPNITFSKEDHSTDIFVNPKDDTFRVLYEKWL